MANAYPSQTYGVLGQNANTIPAYGGDCALVEAPDGLASSTQRLSKLVYELNSATWNLREYFGMSVPEGKPSGETIGGHKAEIDRSAAACRAALENVNLVLDHLRS
jgi:hypothetical protein